MTVMWYLSEKVAKRAMLYVLSGYKELHVRVKRNQVTLHHLKFYFVFQ